MGRGNNRINRLKSNGQRIRSRNLGFVSRDYVHSDGEIDDSLKTAELSKELWRLSKNLETLGDENNRQDAIFLAGVSDSVSGGDARNKLSYLADINPDYQPSRLIESGENHPLYGYIKLFEERTGREFQHSVKNTMELFEDVQR